MCAEFAASGEDENKSSEIKPSRETSTTRSFPHFSLKGEYANTNEQTPKSTHSHHIQSVLLEIPSLFIFPFLWSCCL